jgi:hypothetical protein
MSGKNKGSPMDDLELTQEEKTAFQRLPREAEPSRILEERVVKSLREEGILGRSVSLGVKGGMGSGSSHWFRPWMAAASVAASLVLFSSGVLLGHWMGAGSTTQAFIAVRDQDAAQLALSIQEAGSDYVSALAALSELRGGGPFGGSEVGAPSQAAADFQQGHEVALGALYGAVYELARMAPEDADVARVLQILQERRAREDGRQPGEVRMMWF